MDAMETTLSKSTLIEPGLANAHAYPPSLRLPWSSVLGLVPGVQTWKSTNLAVPWMPWKSTLSKSTRQGCHPALPVPMEIHTSTNLQCHGCHGNPHWIPVYPYRARVCQRPCISTQSDSVPWMPWKSTKGRACQCPWTSTMDAMEIHTQSTLIGPGLPVPWTSHGNPPWKSTLSQSTLRAGSRVCQHACHGNPAPLSKSTLIGPGFANAHAYPPSRTQCHVDAMEIHTILANAHAYPPSLSLC